MKDEKNKEIAELLTETVRDFGAYPNAILRLGPDLDRKQLIFLWERAINDLRSEDNEFVWFAQFSLRSLASIFPNDLRAKLITEELIQEFHSAMHTRRDIIASIVYAKSQVVSDAERVGLQLEAVKRFYSIREDSSVEYIHLDVNLISWICNNGSLLEGDVLWWIWKQCIEMAPTGMYSEKPGFYGFVKILAEIIPNKYIDDAGLKLIRNLSFYLDSGGDLQSFVK